MTDKPINLKAWEARAFQDGRKTMICRPLKPQLGNIATAIMINGKWSFMDRQGVHANQILTIPFTVGDRLWCREAWRAEGRFDHLTPSQIPATSMCHFESDGVAGEWSPRTASGRRRASVHMHRWASRLTLTVADVRPMQVQGIPEADAMALGAAWHGGGATGHSGWRHDLKDVHADARSAFARVWNADHGPDAWDQNEWIAAYTVTVQRGNIDEVAP